MDLDLLFTCVYGNDLLFFSVICLSVNMESIVLFLVCIGLGSLCMKTTCKISSNGLWYGKYWKMGIHFINAFLITFFLLEKSLVGTLCLSRCLHVDKHNSWHCNFLVTSYVWTTFPSNILFSFHIHIKQEKARAILLQIIRMLKSQWLHPEDFICVKLTWKAYDVDQNLY